MLDEILAGLVRRSTGRGSFAPSEPRAPAGSHRHRRIAPSQAGAGKRLANDRSPPIAEALDVRFPSVPVTVVTVFAELAWRQYQTAGRRFCQRSEIL